MNVTAYSCLWQRKSFSNYWKNNWFNFDDRSIFLNAKYVNISICLKQFKIIFKIINTNKNWNNIFLSVKFAEDIEDLLVVYHKNIIKG